MVRQFELMTDKMRSTLILYEQTQALHVCHSAANKSLIIAGNLLLFYCLFIVIARVYKLFVNILFFNYSQIDVFIF